MRSSAVNSAQAAGASNGSGASRAVSRPLQCRVPTRPATAGLASAASPPAVSNTRLPAAARVARWLKERGWGRGHSAKRNELMMSYYFAYIRIIYLYDFSDTELIIYLFQPDCLKPKLSISAIRVNPTRFIFTKRKPLPIFSTNTTQFYPII